MCDRSHLRYHASHYRDEFVAMHGREPRDSQEFAGWVARIHRERIERASASETEAEAAWRLDK
jgi:hypothetical protein